MSDTPKPDFDECSREAARLLRWAEGETDLMKQERLTEIAQSWINLAGLIHEHKRI